jgi:hypothetical protein
LQSRTGYKGEGQMVNQTSNHAKPVQTAGQPHKTAEPSLADKATSQQQWQLQAKRDDKAGKSYVLLKGATQPQLNVFASDNPTTPQTLTGAAALQQFRQAVDSNTPVPVAIANPEAWQQKTVLPVNAQGPVTDTKTKPALKPTTIATPYTASTPETSHNTVNTALKIVGVAGVSLLAIAARKRLPNLAKTVGVASRHSNTVNQTLDAADLAKKAASWVPDTTLPQPKSLPGKKLRQWLKARGQIASPTHAATHANQPLSSALKQNSVPLTQSSGLSAAQKVQQAFEATDFTPHELKQLGQSIRQIRGGTSPQSTLPLPTAGLGQANNSVLARSDSPLNYHITQVMTKLDIDPQNWTPEQVSQAQALIAKAVAGKQATPTALKAARASLNGTPHQSTFDQIAQKLQGQYDEPTRQHILTQLAQQLPGMNAAQLKQLDAAIAHNPLAGVAAPKALLPQTSAKAKQALDQLPQPGKHWRHLLNSGTPQHHAQVLPPAKVRLNAVQQRLQRVDQLLADPKLNPLRRAAHQLEKRAMQTEQRHMQQLNNAAHNGFAWLKGKLTSPNKLMPKGSLKSKPKGQPLTTTQPSARTFRQPVGQLNTAKAASSVQSGEMARGGGLLTHSYSAQSRSSLLHQAVQQLPQAEQTALSQSLKTLLIQPNAKGTLLPGAGNTLISKSQQPYDDQIAQLVDRLMPGHLDNLRQQGADIAPVLTQAKQHVAQQLTQRQLASGQHVLNAARQQLSQSQTPETVALTQQVLKRLNETYADTPAFAQQASQQLLQGINNGTVQPEVLKQLLAAKPANTVKTGLRPALSPTQQALNALPPGSTAPQTALPNLPLKQLGITPQQLQAVVDHPHPDKFAKLWQRANQRLQTLQGRATQLQTLIHKPGNPLSAVHQQELKLIETEMRRIQDGSNAVWQVLAPLMMSTM